MAKPKYQDEDYQSLHRPINLPEPSASHHPATKNYVDLAIIGIKYKPVRLRESTNVDISQLNNGDTIDSVTVATGDRVLLDGQTTASQDGIYIVGATAGTTVRATDLPTGFDATGYSVMVQEGTAHGNKIHLQTAEPAIVGTDGLTFTAVNGGTTYTFDGQGIEESGGTVTIELDGTTLTKGASGLRIGSGVAGAGLTESSGVLAVGDGGEGVTVNANDVALDFSTVARWRTSLGPAGAGSSFQIAHGLGHKNLVVNVVRESDGLRIDDGVETVTDATNITVTFGASQADRSAFRVNWVG